MQARRPLTPDYSASSAQRAAIHPQRGLSSLIRPSLPSRGPPEEGPRRGVTSLASPRICVSEARRRAGPTALLNRRFRSVHSVRTSVTLSRRLGDTAWATPHSPVRSPGGHHTAPCRGAAHFSRSHRGRGSAAHARGWPRFTRTALRVRCGPAAPPRRVPRGSRGTRVEGTAGSHGHLRGRICLELTAEARCGAPRPGVPSRRRTQGAAARGDARGHLSALPPGLPSPGSGQTAAGPPARPGAS